MFHPKTVQPPRGCTQVNNRFNFPAMATVVRLADVELARSIEKGAPEDVRAWIDRGADLETGGPDGVLPLHRAVIEQRLEMVWTLLAAGACTQATDANGATALDVAATLDSTEIVRALVVAGSPIDHPSDEGYTPLMSAVGNSPRIVAILLDAGADPGLTNDDGRTALDEALALGDLSSAELLFCIRFPVSMLRFVRQAG